MQQGHLSYIFTFFLSSCANPLNPFGNSILDILKAESKIKLTNKKYNADDIKISMFPERQNLHQTHELIINIHSQDNQNILNFKNLRIYWNNQLVTEGIKNISKISHKNYNLSVKIPVLKLKPELDHEIKVVYQTKNSVIEQIYHQPKCLISELNLIDNFGPYKSNDFYKNKIEEYSLQKDINPSLVSGLIASESSFNPKAVSYAKAIGLTQITNIAHKQLQDEYPSWSIDKRTRILPAPIVKTLVKMKRISNKHDWRLDASKSIQGGVSYLEYLNNYWDKFDSNFKISAQEKTNLILASYNFGPYRIKRHYLKSPRNWINHKSLIEAKKYTNKIKSYCYHFTNHKRNNYDKKAYHF